MPRQFQLSVVSDQWSVIKVQPHDHKSTCRLHEPLSILTYKTQSYRKLAIIICKQSHDLFNFLESVQSPRHKN